MSKASLRAAYLETIPDIEPCDALLALTAEEELRDLPYIGLILLAPETFALGCALPLIRRLESDGFVPLDVAIADPLSEDQIAAMFVPSMQPRRYRFWLIASRFQMGPTAALLVTHPDAEPTGSILQRRKGHRLPIRADIGTWRGDFGAISGVLNLIHTADEPIHMIRQSAPFFSAERVSRALTNAGAFRRTHEKPAFRWSDVARYSVLPFERPNSSCRSFRSVYLAVLRRIIAVEWLETRDPDFAVAERELAAVAKVAATSTGSQCWNLPATSAVAARSRSAFHTILAALLDVESMPNVAWDRELARLLAAGIGIDPWEKLILLSTLYYADEEIARSDGEQRQRG